MVAFTGNGLVKTQRAKTSPTTNRQRQISDRLVKIVSYDLTTNTMRATQTIKGADGAEDRELILDIKIADEAIKRNNQSAIDKGLENTSKFKGHLIDDKMARDMPPGGLAVIERSEVKGKMTKDQEEVFQIEGQRVINVPNTEPGKVIEGIITVSSWDKKVNFIQHWNERAISGDNEEGIEKLSHLMDEAVENYGKKVGPAGKERSMVRPSVGIQLRAIVPFSDPENPRTKYQVIDTSGPLDYIPAQKDDSGEVVQAGHPLDSENFKQYLQGYTDYVKENHPGDVRVEICPYFNYPASSQSATLAIKDNANDPIAQMASAETRLSQDDDSKWVGKNWAVKGILQISRDSEIREGRQITFVDAFYVNKIHANNIKGHVHSWVNSEDGGKTVPHPKLQRIRPEAAKTASASHTQQAPQESHVEEAMDPDDPFGDKPSAGM